MGIPGKNRLRHTGSAAEFSFAGITDLASEALVELGETRLRFRHQCSVYG